MLAAKAIMNRHVITVPESEDIYEAIRIMVLNNITGLPVLRDDGTLAGIISEKDVLRLLYNIEDKPGTVARYMTTDVVCFDQEDSLHDIAESFVKNNFRRVPILSQGKLVGIISRKDIIRHLDSLKHTDQVSDRDGVCEIVY
jgi:CBS domain-containing protein